MAKKNKFGINEAAILSGVFAVGLHFTPGVIWGHVSFACALIAGELVGHILTIQAQKKLKWDAESKSKKQKELLSNMSAKELQNEIVRRKCTAFKKKMRDRK